MVTQEGVFLAGKDACLGELGDVVRRILSKIFGLLWGEMRNLMQGLKFLGFLATFVLPWRLLCPLRKRQPEGQRLEEEELRGTRKESGTWAGNEIRAERAQCYATSN